MGSPLSIQFKSVRAPVPSSQSIGSINVPPCLLVAYFQLCDVVLPVIVDTGATISCLPEHGLVMLKKRPRVRQANLNAIMADNFIVHMDKQATVNVRPKGDDGTPKSLNFYVCNGQSNLLGYQAIIGLDALKLFEVRIEFHCSKAKLYWRRTPGQA